MAARNVTYETITAALAAAGLQVRGGFHPRAADAVPPLADGMRARTLVLVGNAGPALWAAFARRPAAAPSRDPLDDWVRLALADLAGDLGAAALFPFDGPPYLPFQRWALRAEPVSVSPIGILIHPDYGLWHAYRGALVLAERIALPRRARRASPCETCADKPCLGTCPVSAFTPGAYDVAACVDHVTSEGGTDCGSGCLARRACPVGRDYAYAPAQGAFHMAAFLRAQAPG